MISVIVPVHNTGKLLVRCLDSIVNQTYSNIELIVVDDGSTDDSPELIKNYVKSEQAKKITSIKAIYKDNEGVSVGRNTGLDAATGDWVMFVDADDYIEPDICMKAKMAYTLRRQLTTFCTANIDVANIDAANIDVANIDTASQASYNQECDIICFDWYLGEHEYEEARANKTSGQAMQSKQAMQSSQATQSSQAMQQANSNIPDVEFDELGQEEFHKFMIGALHNYCTEVGKFPRLIWGSCCCKFYNMEFLKKNNIRFTKGLIIGEDVFFNLEAFDKAEYGLFLNDKAYIYRMNENSALHRYNPKMFEATLLALKTIHDYLVESGHQDLMDYYYVYGVRKFMYCIRQDYCSAGNKNSYNYRRKRFLNDRESATIRECFDNVNMQYIKNRKAEYVLAKLTGAKAFASIDACNKLLNKRR